MFGIGFQEVIVVLVATFVLIGPNRLLKLADHLERWARASPSRRRYPRALHLQTEASAWLIYVLATWRGEQLPPPHSLATLARWIWGAPLTLALVGIVRAVVSEDQRMLSRSVTVLLATLVLQRIRKAFFEQSD